MHLKITLESLQIMCVQFIIYEFILIYGALLLIYVLYDIFENRQKMGISVAFFMLPLPYSIMQKLCLRIGNYTSVICRWCFKALLDVF